MLFLGPLAPELGWNSPFRWQAACLYSGKLRSHVHRGSAALAVKAAHGQVVGALDRHSSLSRSPSFALLPEPQCSSSRPCAARKNPRPQPYLRKARPPLRPSACRETPPDCRWTAAPRSSPPARSPAPPWAHPWGYPTWSTLMAMCVHCIFRPQRRQPAAAGQNSRPAIAAEYEQFAAGSETGDDPGKRKCHKLSGAPCEPGMRIKDRQSSHISFLLAMIPDTILAPLFIARGNMDSRLAWHRV